MTAQVGVRHGNEIWREFRSSTGLDSDNVKVAAMFDLHDVVNTMTFDEACDTGVDLEFIDEVATFLCSKGKNGRPNTFLRSNTFSPMINECDGHIFTDYTTGHHRNVDIYKEPWMPTRCIGVKGDKGQIASLMRKPVLLFDDRRLGDPAQTGNSFGSCTSVMSTLGFF